MNKIDPLGLYWGEGAVDASLNFLNSVMHSLNPEPVLTDVAEVLLDPTTPTTIILIEVDKHNKQQAYNGTPENMIDAAWAEKHPLEVLKKLNEYKKKNKTCPPK